MKIILTGGAGFIGSCFLWKLNNVGISDILVVDHLNKLKEKNLVNKKFKDYIEKKDFLPLIQKNKIKKIDAVIHLGACTNTMETNIPYILENNFYYSKILVQWALQNNSLFFYASSGATYGNGENGFSDEDENTLKLMPLNLYGLSKHFFDFWIIDNKLSDKVVGFKFFNVFGPNEYHKGEMRSVVLKSYEKIKKDGEIYLFKSYRKEYLDGEQKRDFVYVKDVIEVMYYFIKNPDKKGIFNIGTGEAKSFNQLAISLFSSLNMKPKIHYFDMPEDIREKYQYFTEADLKKLRKAGCNHKFMKLDEAISDYVSYLKENKYL